MAGRAGAAGYAVLHCFRCGHGTAPHPLRPHLWLAPPEASARPGEHWRDPKPLVRAASARVSDAQDWQTPRPEAPRWPMPPARVTAHRRRRTTPRRRSPSRRLRRAPSRAPPRPASGRKGVPAGLRPYRRCPTPRNRDWRIPGCSRSGGAIRRWTRLPLGPPANWLLATRATRRDARPRDVRAAWKAEFRRGEGRSAATPPIRLLLSAVGPRFAMRRPVVPGRTAVPMAARLGSVGTAPGTIRRLLHLQQRARQPPAGSPRVYPPATPWAVRRTDFAMLFAGLVILLYRSRSRRGAGGGEREAVRQCLCDDSR